MVLDEQNVNLWLQEGDTGVNDLSDIFRDAGSSKLGFVHVYKAENKPIE